MTVENIHGCTIVQCISEIIRRVSFCRRWPHGRLAHKRGSVAMIILQIVFSHMSPTVI